MNTYRLIPQSAGSHWGLHENRGEAIVRARSTGEARALAALAEAESIAPPGKARTVAARSAFRNPILYRVILCSDTGFGQDGDAGVLEISLHSPSGVDRDDRRDPSGRDATSASSGTTHWTIGDG